MAMQLGNKGLNSDIVNEMSWRSVPTMTELALTMAQASFPTARPRVSTLPLVTVATTGVPPLRVSVTSAFTAPFLIPLTVPSNTLRALSFMVLLLNALWPLQRGAWTQGPLSLRSV